MRPTALAQLGEHFAPREPLDDELGHLLGRRNELELAELERGKQAVERDHVDALDSMKSMGGNVRGGKESELHQGPLHPRSMGAHTDLHAGNIPFPVASFELLEQETDHLVIEMDHLEDPNGALQLVPGEPDGADGTAVLARDQVVGTLCFDLEKAVVQRQRPEDFAPPHSPALDSQQVGVPRGRKLLDLEPIDVRVCSGFLVDDHVRVDADVLHRHDREVIGLRDNAWVVAAQLKGVAEVLNQPGEALSVPSELRQHREQTDWSEAVRLRDLLGERVGHATVDEPDMEAV